MGKKISSILICIVLLLASAQAAGKEQWEPMQPPNEIQSDSDFSKEYEAPVYGYLGNLTEPVYSETEGAYVYPVDIDGDGKVDLTVLDENVIRVKVPSTIYAVYRKDLERLMGLEMEDDGKTPTGELVAPAGAIRNLGSSSVNVDLARFEEERGNGVSDNEASLATSENVMANMNTEGQHLYSLVVSPQGADKQIDVAAVNTGGEVNMFQLPGSLGAEPATGWYELSGSITNALFKDYGMGPFDATRGEDSLNDLMAHSIIQGTMVYKITLAVR